jgi:hypothetical protein
VVGRHHSPWAQGERAAAKSPLQIAVGYDRTRLAVNDTIRAKATLKFTGRRPTFMVLVDLEIPPGFAVGPGDFAEMVDSKQVQKFRVTPRTVTLFLGEVLPGAVRTFE